jgi:hypothetical protein
VSGYSPATLLLLGLVFVVALCLSILAVRRDHPNAEHPERPSRGKNSCAIEAASGTVNSPSSSWRI